jgi:hypothetical protein
VEGTRPGKDRIRSFQFAPLAKCRRQFEAHARAPNIEWESENEPKSDPTVAVVRQTAEDVGEPTELDAALDAPKLDGASENEARNRSDKVNSSSSELLQTGIAQAAADLALVRSKK